MSKEALNYVYRIISRKDYTECEIREKLIFKFNLDEGKLKQIIDKLKAEGLIDDMRFAKMYTEHKILAGYGPLYIIAALKKKGINIDEKYFNSIADSMDIDIKNILKDLLIKKHITRIDKCYAFLQRRGYKTDKINDSIKEVNEDGSIIF